MQGWTQKGCSAGAVPYMGAYFFFSPSGVAKVAKTLLSFSRHCTCPLSYSSRYKYLCSRELLLFVIIIGDMMIGIAPFANAWAWARKKETLARNNSFFRTKYPHLMKRSGWCAWPHPSFWSDSICGHLSSCKTFLEVLLFAMRVVATLIISMATVVSAFIVIALVTLMVVTVLATMMLVVLATGTSNRKMSHLLLLWLFLLLELVKVTGSFVGRLALLKKGHMLKRVRIYHFVCFCELNLRRLWLREKD